MKTENKIIKAFLPENKNMTIRQITKKIKADYRITHTAVQRLIKKNILTKEVIGKSSLCRLNEKYYGSEIYQAEEERKNQLLRNKDLKILYKDVIEKIDTSFFIFLLFGSYVNGTKTKHSDIDLMFISNMKNFEDRVHNVLSLLPLKIHALVFTEEQFKSMIDSKEFNVGKEALKNYIILYGIENFYRLKNA